MNNNIEQNVSTLVKCRLCQRPWLWGNANLGIPFTCPVCERALREDHDCKREKCNVCPAR